MTNLIIKSKIRRGGRTIKSILGLAFIAGVVTAATGCDQTDMQLLSALGNTLAAGSSQQQSASQNPSASVSDPTSSLGGNQDWSGSYAFAFATTKP